MRRFTRLVLTFDRAALPRWRPQERAPNRVTFKPESVIRDDEDERKVARLLSWKGR